MTEYPYLPVDRSIQYVPLENPYMQAARDFAKEHSLDSVVPTGSVVVGDDEILGYGANGSDFHENNTCERVLRGIPTGQGYELCEGCHPNNHSEPKAIADAVAKYPGRKLDAIYLWGHWWCCEPCWKAIIAHGINEVFLASHSEVLFNKEHPDNVVGRQFADMTELS